MTATETIRQTQALWGITADGLPYGRTDARYAELKAQAASERQGGASEHFDGIVDLYHGEPIDLQAAWDGGIRAIIHKASEGLTYKDPLYTTRRNMAKQIGFLFGSYHFSSGDDGARQAEHYLATALPAPNELICLDWEASTHGADMSLTEAERFVKAILEATGRHPVIYSGLLAREQIGNEKSSLLSACSFWLAQYAPAPTKWPMQVWEKPDLWQFSDNAPIPGLGEGDRNRYFGSESALRAAWPLS